MPCTPADRVLVRTRGRKLQAFGHRVILLPPHHVRPYIRRNKTDRTDAKGILEASRNEDIRPVPVKTVDQQVLTSLHRLRSGWMRERTARLNALRGLLRELGVFFSRTRALRPRFLSTENGHAALRSGVTRGYQNDSSSKRPAFSADYGPQGGQRHRPH
jgi:transposase